MFKLFIQSTSQINQQDIPKVAVLKRSTKGAMRSSFRRASYT